MSKRNTLRALALITAMLFIPSVGQAVQYLTPDLDIEPIYLNSYWQYDYLQKQWFTPRMGWDTMPDTASGDPSIWYCGPFLLETNKLYLHKASDADSSGYADSTNIYVVLKLSPTEILPGASGWFPYDSTQFKAKPANIAITVDSLDCIRGMYGLILVIDSLATYDTTSHFLRATGYLGDQLP